MRRATLAAVLIGLAIGPVLAVPPAPFADRPPEQLAADAFDAPYGRLLVAEFGRILRLNADADCLRSRAIATSDLETHARDVLVRNGARMLGIYSDLLDGATLEAALTRRAGPKAKADFEGLRTDPDVVRHGELAEPAKLAALADQIAQTLDRRALLARLRLRPMLAPTSTGNESLLRANPARESSEAAERFLKSRDSPALRRWLELQNALADAAREFESHESVTSVGPIQLMPDLPLDLERLCIGRR